MSQIKSLLNAEDDIVKNLQMQSKLLAQKSDALAKASQLLDEVAQQCVDLDKSLPYEKVIELIEVYTMTQKLEDAWVKDIFTHQELKQYAEFESALTKDASKEQKQQFEQNWAALRDEFAANIKADPNSEVGIRLGKKLMDWVNQLYGKKYAHLRTKKFEQGFAKGKGLAEHGLNEEIVSWMDKAVDAYWQHRVRNLLKEVEKTPDKHKLLSQWQQLMDEICGNQQEKKQSIKQQALADDAVSQVAKDWLRSELG